MNILITGSNGYIGRNLNKKLSSKYNITTINRQVFDLRDYYSTREWFANKFFDVVIHTAIKGGSRLHQDNSNIIDDNIKMYYNLLNCRDNYTKLINIGSGAEIYDSNSYYGLSKKIINHSILDKPNFYTLRIYGLFNENEINTRFIKTNIIRYINKENLVVYKNRLMDFIYFDDFTKIIETYIDNDNLDKDIDCVYTKKYSLLDITSFINKLDNYTVDIEIVESITDYDYIGTSVPSNICSNFIGLEQGIINSYRKIKHEENMVCTK